MPFLAEERVPIPTKDLLSWYFDEPQFDQDSPIYIDSNDESRSWTSRQARRTIRKLAAGFQSRGLVPGDCVCVVGYNDIDYPILVNGINGFGGVYTGANPAYKEAELVHHLRLSGAAMVIAEPQLLRTVSAAANHVGIRNERILAFQNSDTQTGEGFQSWKSLLQHGERDWPRFDDLQKAKETTAALLFSSGTTGLPKAVMLSHHNLVAAYTLHCETKPSPWKRRRLMALPMFHAATAPLCHYSPLRGGDEIFVMRTFNLEQYMSNIETHAITNASFVPPIIHQIRRSPLREKYSLHSIRHAHVGAAPLDTHSQAQFQKLLRHDAPLNQVWGMTETTGTCTLLPESEGVDATGSVGRMLPNIDAKLVDEEGRDIGGDNTRGELCVRGPLVARGYHNDLDANRRDWDEDGFFHTGDIASRDSKTKRWYIVDRKKELIKVRGHQVAPMEIEGALLSHPDIVQAAVVGVPAGNGEVPRAYVVTKPGLNSAASEEQLKSYLAERLARYKQCDGGIIFVDSIPVSQSGKVLRRVLKEQARNDMAFSKASRI